MCGSLASDIVITQMAQDKTSAQYIKDALLERIVGSIENDREHEYDLLAQKYARLSSDVSAMQEALGRLVGNGNTAEPLARLMEKFVTNSELQIHSLRAERDSLHEEYKKLQQSDSQAKSRLNVEHDDAQRNQAELAAVSEELKRWKQQHKRDEKEKNSLLHKLSVAQSDSVKAVEDSNQNTKKELHKWQKKCARLEEKFQAAQRDAAQSHSEMNGAVAQIQFLQSELTSQGNNLKMLEQNLQQEKAVYLEKEIAATHQVERLHLEHQMQLQQAKGDLATLQNRHAVEMQQLSLQKDEECRGALEKVWREAESHTRDAVQKVMQKAESEMEHARSHWQDKMQRAVKEATQAAKEDVSSARAMVKALEQVLVPASGGLEASSTSLRHRSTSMIGGGGGGSISHIIASEQARLSQLQNEIASLERTRERQQSLPVVPPGPLSQGSELLQLQTQLQGMKMEVQDKDRQIRLVEQKVHVLEGQLMEAHRQERERELPLSARSDTNTNASNRQDIAPHRLLSMLKEDNSHLKVALESARVEMSFVEEQHRQQREETLKAQAEISLMQQEKRQIVEELSQCKSRLDDMLRQKEQQVSAWDSEIEMHRQELQRLRRENEQKEQKAEEAEEAKNAEMHRLERQLEQQTDELHLYAKKADLWEQQVAEGQSAIVQLQSQLDGLRHERHALQQKYEEEIAQRSAKDEELRLHRGELSQVRGQISMLQEAALRLRVSGPSLSESTPSMGNKPAGNEGAELAVKWQRKLQEMEEWHEEESKSLRARLQQLTATVQERDAELQACQDVVRQLRVKLVESEATIHSLQLQLGSASSLSGVGSAQGQGTEFLASAPVNDQQLQALEEQLCQVRAVNQQLLIRIKESEEKMREKGKENENRTMERETRNLSLTQQPMSLAEINPPNVNAQQVLQQEVERAHLVLQRDVEGLQRKVQNLQVQKEGLDSDVQQLQEEMSALRQKKEHLTGLSSSLDSECAMMDSEMESRRERNRGKKAEAESVRTEEIRLIETLSGRLADLEIRRQELQGVEKDSDLLHRELKECYAAKAKVEDEIVEVKEAKVQGEKQLQILGPTHEDLRERLQQMETSVEEQKWKLSSAKDEHDRMVAEVRGLRSQSEDLQRELLHFQEDNSEVRKKLDEGHLEQGGLERKLQELEGVLVEQRLAVSAACDEEELLMKRLAAVQESIHERSRDFQQEKEALDRMSDDYARLHRDLSERREDLEQLRQQEEASRLEVADTTRAIQAYGAEIRPLREQKERLEQESLDLQREIEQLKALVSKQQETSASTDQERQSITMELATKDAQLLRLRKEISDWETLNARLSADLLSQTKQASTARTQMITALAEIARSTETVRQSRGERQGYSLGELQATAPAVQAVHYGLEASWQLAAQTDSSNLREDLYETLWGLDSGLINSSAVSIESFLRDLQRTLPASVNLDISSWRKCEHAVSTLHRRALESDLSLQTLRRSLEVAQFAGGGGEGGTEGPLPARTGPMAALLKSNEDLLRQLENERAVAVTAKKDVDNMQFQIDSVRQEADNLRGMLAHHSKFESMAKDWEERYNSALGELSSWQKTLDDWRSRALEAERDSSDKESTVAMMRSSKEAAERESLKIRGEFEAMQREMQSESESYRQQFAKAMAAETEYSQSISDLQQQLEESKEEIHRLKQQLDGGDNVRAKAIESAKQDLRQRLYDAENDKQILESQVGKLKLEVERLRAEMKDSVQKTVEEYSQRAASLRKEIHDTSVRMQEFEKQSDELRRENMGLKHSISDLEEAKGEVEMDLRRLRQQVEDQKAFSSQKSSELQNSVSQVKDKDAVIMQLQEEVREAKNKHARLDSDRQALRQTITQHETVMEELRQKGRRDHEEHLSLTSQIGALEDQISSLKDALQREERSLTERAHTMDELRAEMESLNREKKAASERVLALQGELGTAKRRISETESEIEELQGRNQQSQSALQSSRHSATELSSQVSHLENELALLGSQLSTAKRIEKELQDNLDQQRLLHNEQNALNVSRQQRIHDLSEQRLKDGGKIDQLEADIRQLKKVLEDTKSSGMNQVEALEQACREREEQIREQQALAGTLKQDLRHQQARNEEMTGVLEQCQRTIEDDEKQIERQESRGAELEDKVDKLARNLKLAETALRAAKTDIAQKDEEIAYLESQLRNSPAGKK